MLKKLFIFNVLLLLPVFVFASTETWIDEGNYSYDWYVNDSDYSGEGDGKYYINDAKDLAGLSAITNSIVDVDLTKLENKTIIIKNDIDLSAHEWVPIYELKNVTFDGNNKKISNVNSTKKIGFIDEIHSSYIKNLFFSAKYDVDSTNAGGGFVTESFISTLDNITSNVDISVINNNYDYLTIGGIVEFMYYDKFSVPSTIKNCKTSGNINIINKYKQTKITVGGIAAQLVGERIINSSNYININVKVENADNVFTDIGGLFGENFPVLSSDNLTYSAMVVNSYNRGNINFSADNSSAGANIGGINANCE